MNLTHEDVDFLAFDPPYLGIPDGPCLSGRWEDNAHFVEIFLRVENDRIADAGFLTSVEGEGVALSSLCCSLLRGRDVQEIGPLQASVLLAPLPEDLRRASTIRRLADACVIAGQHALDAARSRD